jgi:hypothetical protein
MNSMWVLPFMLQGIFMAIDEFYFHRRRWLPRWERIGHPFDSFSVVLCYGYMIFVPTAQIRGEIYLCLAILSCILVTKDEFVHWQNCSAKELWLHAMLFILHPVTLYLAFQMQPSQLLPWFFIVGMFCIYQVFYWNFSKAPDGD